MYQRIVYVGRGRIEVDTCVRERLRCEWFLGEHPLRPDFPPDVVLRDQDPPELILKDQVTPNTYWAVDFGSEITVEEWPFAGTWVNGVGLPGGWVVEMRAGEMVVRAGVGAAPVISNLTDAPFVWEVVGEELRYTPRAGRLGFGFFEVAWALYFGEEIVVMPWPYMNPINGIVLNQGWVMFMKRGELVQEKPNPLPVPFLAHKPDRWKFGLEVGGGGELVYSPVAFI